MFNWVAKKDSSIEALWRVLLGTKAVARLAMLDDLKQEYQATTAVEIMFPKIKQGTLSDSSKQAYNKNKYWWMRKL